MDARENEIFEKLAAELSVDAASAEYYVGMPFDERLHLLLDNELSTTIIKATGETSQPLDPRFFPPNSILETDVMIDEKTIEPIQIDAYTYQLSGALSLDRDKLTIDATINSDLNDERPVHIRNSYDSDDEFIIYKDTFDGMVSDRISTKELAALFGSLSDIDLSAINKSFSSHEEDTPANITLYRRAIETIWSHLGEATGSKIRRRTLIVPLAESNENFSEFIKLRYEEEEKIDESIIRLVLENAKEIERADVEDVHTLKLVFSSESKENLNQSAQRVVSSGMSPMNLLSIDGQKKVDGRVTNLNLNDPEVIKQFVDWFDQLVSN